MQFDTAGINLNELNLPVVRTLHAADVVDGKLKITPPVQHLLQGGLIAGMVTAGAVLLKR